MRILAKDAVNHIGEEITLEGWIHNLRELPEFSFIVLRDRTGTVQGILENPDFEVPQIGNEYVIRMKGNCVKSEIAKAGFEIKVTGIEVLSKVVDELPTQVNKKNPVEHLDRLLDYRYFSLRHPKLAAVFKVQSCISRGFREYLSSQEFTEIHTPKIVASGTEGGANLFKVDYFGHPAYLAQSPQFYKQMMVGVFERVFEVAPVFRAEPHNTSRHVNEYTSLDFEMGYIKDENDIMDMEEAVLQYVVGLVNETCQAELELLGAKVSIPAKIPRMRMTEVHEILEKKYKIKYPQGFDIDPEGERAICEYVQKEAGSEFVFIDGYPIEARPMYTMPDLEHPGDTRGFDLIYRGMEITTGGQRIHGFDMLVDNIRKFKCNPDDFTFYTDVFKYGMPPHGGLAIGLERITCQMLGLKNIREGTLFPRDLDRLTP
ncbi:MAG: aspartate--tRNA(Asn) ligase [Caldisericales bacterium]|nr:aspartate--tRNA(Asn) ligase [Caldisericales bacterium]